MSPRSSVYRTKPIIHADLSGTRTIQPSSTDLESVFEFPQSKQPIETKVLEIFNLNHLPIFLLLNLFY